MRTVGTNAKPWNDCHIFAHDLREIYDSRYSQNNSVLKNSNGYYLKTEQNIELNAIGVLRLATAIYIEAEEQLNKKCTVSDYARDCARG